MAKQRQRPKPRAESGRNRRRIEDQKVVGPKPRKLVPGVVGRSAWFTQRAGSHERALSTDRLTTAIAAAERMPDPATVRDLTFQEAQSALARVGRAARARLLKTPFLLDESGRARAVKARRQSLWPVTALSTALEVGDAGYLFIPARMRSEFDLDIDRLFVADVSDPDRLRLNHTFTYWPEEDLFVGRLWHGGVYEVHGWPRDPLRRAAFETVARYWPLVHRATNDTPVDQIVDHLIGLLGPGLGKRQARALIRLDDGIRPPFVKHWWDVIYLPPDWLPVGPTPAANFGGIGRVTQIAIHPTDGNVLIAGTAGGGVWRTNNGGVFWWWQMFLQPTLTIGAVAIAPSNPQIVYAASGEDGGGDDPAWAGVGLYRSNNGGATWTLMTGIPSTRFSAIAVHPTRPNTVYLAGNRGLHKSIDGGLTWRTNPGQQSLFDAQITDVVVVFEEPVISARLIDPAVSFPFLPERVYIGVSNDGVYRSTDGGEQSGATPAFTRLDGPDRLPSGSSAGWTKLTVGRGGAHGSRFLAAKLGPNGSRIFTTIDGGDTWTERAQDVASVGYDEWCSVIAVDPRDENVLYAGAAGTLKRTLNGGFCARRLDVDHRGCARGPAGHRF